MTSTPPRRPGAGPLVGRLNELADEALVSERMIAAGMSVDRTTALFASLQHCSAALVGMGARTSSPVCAFVVPGRIEVLGKHTDYAGGRSLLAAPELGVVVTATPRVDGRVDVMDVASGQAASFALAPDATARTGWESYPLTAARRLARNFPDARVGASIAFTSDLPMAAGMSSSSALLVAVFMALAAVNELESTVLYRDTITSPEALAGYLASVENGQDFGPLSGDTGVGTEGGSEDHTAMVCARPGMFVQYAFAPVRFERQLPLPQGHGFVIADSGVRAEKIGAARERYNRAAALMREAAAIWRGSTGRTERTVGAILDGDGDAVDRLRTVLAAAVGSDIAGRTLPAPPSNAGQLLDRVEQFIAEDREIIPHAGDALAAGDLATFGVLVDRSQSLAESLLGNQIPETSFLASSARELGAVAASAFGAGFGGSVWALLPEVSVDEFRERWREEYESRFPARSADARFFATGAGPAIVRVV